MSRGWDNDTFRGRKHRKVAVNVSEARSTCRLQNSSSTTIISNHEETHAITRVHCDTEPGEYEYQDWVIRPTKFRRLEIRSWTLHFAE